METKKIVEALRLCAEKLGCHRYIVGNCVENISFGKVLDEAAERLEELEAELKKRTINDRPYEWISVEDEPFPGLEKEINVCWNIYPGDLPAYLAYVEPDKGITHWMLIVLPKKESTFKDVFLKAFPGAVVLPKSGAPLVCAKQVFPQLGDDESPCDMCCAVCWSQPYFEPEEEGEE